MSWDILKSDDDSVYLIDARIRKSGHVRAGIVICVNNAQGVARFTLSDLSLSLLIPPECRSPGEIIKALNLDLAILKSDEQVPIARSQ
jgi:hypothetical protein